jgi:nucleotide-binding universal stress UspA family protein
MNNSLPHAGMDAASTRGANPFARIVVGYDESPASAGALENALAYATDYGGDVVVVHVSGVRSAASVRLETAVLAPATDPRPVLESVGPQNHALYERMRPRIADRGVPVTLEFCWNEPAAGILDAALRWKASAIAVGTHGRKSLPHAFLGSVAEAVVQQARVPVVVARDCMPARMLRRVVVGVDPNEPVAAAVTFAVSLAAVRAVRLVLCTVIDTASLMSPLADMPFDPTPLAHQMRAAARDALDAAVLTVQAEDAFTATEVAAAREPAAGLVEVARRQLADAIVVGSHRRSGVARLMLGSTAETLMRISEVPVIVVPTDASRAFSSDHWSSR